VRKWDCKKKKTSKVFEVPRTILKNTVNNKETDHYSTWSETRVALQSVRITCQLLSDDGAEIYWANK
jgi:hypothetical protein